MKQMEVANLINRGVQPEQASIDIHTIRIISRKEFLDTLDLWKAYLRKYFQTHSKNIFKQPNGKEIMEELVHITVIKADLHFDQFKGDSLFKTWITRIFTRNTIDYYNKRKRDILGLKAVNLKDLVSSGDTGSGSATQIEELKGTEKSPEQIMLDQETEDLETKQRERLYEAIGKLKNELQQKIVRLYIEKVPLKDIAVQLNTNDGLVKTYLDRARKGIKKIIEESK